jgi:hypothetical protein
LKDDQLKELGEAVGTYLKKGDATSEARVKRVFDNVDGALKRLGTVSNSKAFKKGLGIAKGVAKRAPLGIGALVSVVTIKSDLEAYGAVEGIGRNLPVVGDMVSLVRDTQELAIALRDIHALGYPEERGDDLIDLQRDAHAKSKVDEIVEGYSNWKIPDNVYFLPENFADDLNSAITNLFNDIKSQIQAVKDPKNGSFKWNWDVANPAIDNAKQNFENALRALNLEPPPGPLG